jgi:hypothetical protein
MSLKNYQKIKIRLKATAEILLFAYQIRGKKSS